MPAAGEDDPQLYPRSERLCGLVDGPETPEHRQIKASRL